MDDIEVTMDASSNEHADDDYNTKIHEHIACYDNIISPEMCREIIDYFEETLTDGSVFTCRDDYSDEEWNELPDISRKIIDEGAYSDGTTQFDQSQLGRKDDSLFLNITSPKYSEITFEALQKGSIHVLAHRRADSHTSKHDGSNGKHKSQNMQNESSNNLLCFPICGV